MVADKTIPWHRKEIFHDDVAKYPLYDCFFLSRAEEKENRDVEEETGQS